MSSLLGTSKEPFSDGMAHNEPWHKKNCLWGFRPGDTKLAIRPQKMVRGLKIRIQVVEDCTIYAAKTKALISCEVTVQLICVFVFTYAKSRFSHDVAHINLEA